MAVLVYCTILLLLHRQIEPTDARDPNYALHLVVPDRERGMLHNQRLVSLPWLEYLAREHEPLEMYYTIQNTPRTLTLKNARTGSERVYRLAENAKRSLVGAVFEQVLHNFLYSLLKVGNTVAVHANAVDEMGVPVNGGRHVLNRTIVISFEDPPYGQSRVNRLVSNRNVPFVVWSGANMDRFRFRRDYNQTEDLVYRYFHNIGHTLGFGHYVNTVLDKNERAETPPWRSIMYADYRDYRYSAATPVVGGVDAIVMSTVLRTYAQLVRDNARRFVTGPFADAVVGLVYAAARVA